MIQELSMRAGTAISSRDTRRQQQCCLQVTRDMGSNSIWDMQGQLLGLSFSLYSTVTILHARSFSLVGACVVPSAQLPEPVIYIFETPPQIRALHSELLD